MLHSEIELRSYANSFWSELNKVFPHSNGEVGYLPIVFADPAKDIRAKHSFGFTHIHINDNTKTISLFPVVFLRNDVSSEEIKETIRHEIIHYYLGIHYIYHEDSSSMFWLLCDIFDGGAYEPMDSIHGEIYEISKPYFKEAYNYYKIKDNKKLVSENLSIMLLLVNKVIGDNDVSYLKSKLNTCVRVCRTL